MEQLEGQASATPTGQGVGSEQVVPEGVQGVTPEQTPSPSATPGQGVDEVRRLQSLADQRLAETYRERAQREALERQLQEARQFAQPTATNPYDPQVNYIQWNKWETQAAIQEAVAKASQTYEQKFARVVQTAQETQWQAQHPDVHIDTVKAFAAERGISRLDDAYTLMNLPQTVQQTYRQASSQALNQFRQPQQGANPLRGAEASGVRPAVTFVETLKAYHANPSIADSWTPEFKADFQRELRIRDSQS